MNLLQHKARATAVLGSLVHPQRDALSLAPVLVAIIPALLGWQWLTLLLLAASALISMSTENERSYLQEVLAFASFGLPALTALRFIVLLLLGSSVWTEPSIAAPIALAGLLIALFMIPARVLLDRLASRMKPRVQTRNLDLPDWPTPAPVALTMSRGLPMAIPELLVLAAGALVASSVVIVWVVSAIAIVASLLLVLFTAILVKRVGDPYRVAILGAVRRAVSELAPEVALYVGTGNAASVYQVKMWLPTLECVEHSAIILIRSEQQFALLGPTTTPVVCLPIMTDFVALDLASLRAGLYVANTGDVIHLVREPTTMSAFIGHGDSDKNSSFNPFAKVYDQIWLAGHAGAQRYRRAQIGVHEDQFTYVGRPQLDAIADASDAESGSRVPTILYAPTWEGWNAEQEYSSLLGKARAFVAAVLSSPTPVRLIYKPHPYIGRRAPAARAAHYRIVALIEAANSAQGLPKQPSQRLPAGQRAALASQSALEAQATIATFAQRYWLELDPRAHAIIEGGDIDLYGCFNEANVLVTDVSSVLSDFMASGKPFAVFNTGNETDDEFRDSYPTTSAGLVISRDGAGIDAVLELACGRIPDAFLGARTAMREYLLGPVQPTATERFVAAVGALVAAADDRNAQRQRGSE